MKIKIKRIQFLPNATIGLVYVNGEVTPIFSLEDACRELPNVDVSLWKIKGTTAIPKGTYPVVVDFSEHFKKRLPHILGVPGFDGVRIHAGNTDKDTEGCILVGHDWDGGDYIGRSRDAFASLFSDISTAIANGENVEIEVV
jgi:hypothetical protein